MQSSKSISRKNIAELELVGHFPKYAGNSFNQIYINSLFHSQHLTWGRIIC